MASTKNLKSWANRLSAGWAVLAQAAVWGIGVIGSFLLPPPIGVANNQTIWLRFAQFLIAASLGIFFVIAGSLSTKKYFRKWMIVSVFLLLLSVFSFIGYQFLSLSLTCKYYSQTVIKGGDYTSEAELYIQKNPGISCEDLIKDYTGEMEQIWTKKSIDRNRIILATVYVICAPLFIACIMAILQLISMSKSKRK